MSATAAAPSFASGWGLSGDASPLRDLDGVCAYTSFSGQGAKGAQSEILLTHGYGLSGPPGAGTLGLMVRVQAGGTVFSGGGALQIEVTATTVDGTYVSVRTQVLPTTLELLTFDFGFDPPFPAAGSLRVDLRVRDPRGIDGTSTGGEASVDLVEAEIIGRTGSAPTFLESSVALGPFAASGTVGVSQVAGLAGAATLNGFVSIAAAAVGVEGVTDQSLSGVRGLSGAVLDISATSAPALDAVVVRAELWIRDPRLLNGAGALGEVEGGCGGSLAVSGHGDANLQAVSGRARLFWWSSKARAPESWTLQPAAPELWTRRLQNPPTWR